MLEEWVMNTICDNSGSSEYKDIRQEDPWTKVFSVEIPVWVKWILIKDMHHDGKDKSIINSQNV